MILDNGLTLVQLNPNCAVDLTGGKMHGWLFIDSGDGYISERKLEAWEIMQAEDQDHYNIILGESNV